MLKNATIYRIHPGWQATLEQACTALEGARFVPCSATQDKSVGWVEPRGEAHAPLVESIAGQWIMRLMIEVKAVPSSAIKKRADEAAAAIEASTGRKPGKKEMKSLKEDALLALLPQAFPRQQGVWVWVDRANNLLITDASSQGKSDEVVTALVRAFDGLALSLLNTQETPTTAMAKWLLATDPAEIPGEFAVERDCVLKSSDEEKSTVKFNRHHLANDEVRRHIAEGKLPTSLAMNWGGRLGFLLTESMQIKKINFLDGVFEGRAEQEDAGFDADVAIATGELGKFIPELIEALGGELLPGQAPGDVKAEAANNDAATLQQAA